MRYLLLLLGWAPTLLVLAQQPPVSFALVDGSGAPLPNVNVYAPTAATGAVSAGDGTVRLPAVLLSPKHERTELRFTAVGIRDTSLAVADALRSGQLVLAKATYELAEANVVDAGDWGGPEQLGERERKAFLCFTTNNRRELTSEAAVAVASDRRCRIDKVYLAADHLSAPEAVVELNFYALDADGVPGESLRREPIRRTVTEREARRTLAFDTGEDAVIADGDFAISVRMADTTDSGGALWLHLPCAGPSRAGWTKTAGGTWATDPGGVFDASTGVMYAEGRCAL